MTTTETTLSYYNANANAFIEDTANVDFHSLQSAFIALLPPHAAVLDVGCGAGRDSLAFLRAGLEITAIDGSEVLCAHASRLLGQTVLCTTFENYQPTRLFDGIWACASLLHLEWTPLIQVMQTLSECLVSAGYFYASFKYGNKSEVRNGRFFTDMTESRFQDVRHHLPSLTLSKQFITNDARPGRENEQWLNVFLRKTVQ